MPNNEYCMPYKAVVRDAAQTVKVSIVFDAGWTERTVALHWLRDQESYKVFL